MLTATFTTTPAFNRGLSALIHQAGLNAAAVVRKETGELIKTLVRLSPPKSPPLTRANIKDRTNAKFEAIAGELRTLKNTSGKIGPLGVTWYSVDETFLRGVAPQQDQRAASAEEIYQLAKVTNKRGRRILGFQYPRRRQRVMIAGRIVTTKRQVAVVVARLQRHVGRLKAGWLVAVTGGDVRLTGAHLPPAWVTRHAVGARGTYTDGTHHPQRPTFEIRNTARGIGGRAVRGIITAALRVRAKAMQANALLFMKGKKNLADYAK